MTGPVRSVVSTAGGDRDPAPPCGLLLSCLPTRYPVGQMSRRSPAPPAVMHTARLGMAVGLCALTLVAAGCRPAVNTYEPPPPPEVDVALPITRDVVDAPIYTATTDVFEKVELRARVQGFLEEIHYEPGDLVEPGQLLFTIDPRPFRAAVDSAAATLAGAQADYELARVNLDRVRELAQRQAASDIEVREREGAFDAAKAAVDLATAQLEAAKLDLGFTEVRAPIRGRISRNLVDEGALVGAAEPTLLASIYNTDRVYAYFTVPERELLEFRRRHPERQDKPVKIPVFLGLVDETGFPHEGHFDSGEPVVDPATGTMRVRAIFENPTDLLTGGLFGRVRVPLESSQALLLPELAVGTDQAGRYVLVVNADNEVERRSVTVGAVEDDGMIRILSGLTPEDRVVVNGVLRARPGATVKPVLVDAAPSAESGASNPAAASGTNPS